MASPKNYLSDVLESITSGLVAVDADGCISIFNRAAAELLGCDAESVLGNPYAELFAHEAGVRKDCLYTLHTGRPLKSQEGTIHTRYGRVIPVRFSTMVVRSADGEIIGAIEILDDLTGVRKLEAELDQNRTYAALGEMAASVAHQIRNPLGGIGGFAALLERDMQADDSRRRLVRKIIEGVASLDCIIGDLLRFTRPLHPDLRQVEVQRNLEDMVRNLERHWQQQGYTINCSVNFPEQPVHARLDPQLFQEMVWHLFHDAVESMGGRGNLRVRVARQESSQRLILELQDPKRILKEEERSRLFYPFYTPHGSGIGLSLAIARRIVDRHHGDITVISEPHAGTVYHIELPLLEAEGEN